MRCETRSPARWASARPSPSRRSRIPARTCASRSLACARAPSSPTEHTSVASCSTCTPARSRRSSRRARDPGASTLPGGASALRAVRLLVAPAGAGARVRRRERHDRSADEGLVALDPLVHVLGDAALEVRRVAGGLPQLALGGEDPHERGGRSWRGGGCPRRPPPPATGGPGDRDDDRRRNDEERELSHHRPPCCNLLLSSRTPRARFAFPV